MIQGSGIQDLDMGLFFWDIVPHCHELSDHTRKLKHQVKYTKNIYIFLSTYPPDLKMSIIFLQNPSQYCSHLSLGNWIH